MQSICNIAEDCTNHLCIHQKPHKLMSTCEPNHCDTTHEEVFCIPYEESKKDAINPSHYQSFIKDMQWIETIQYLPHFRNPESFKAALELQVRKYLDRSGGKDEELQETEKALWYLKFLTAFIRNGNKPIKVKDVDNILKKK